MKNAVEKENSLYDRLGGKKAVAAAVEGFYERVLKDPQLQSFFAKTNMAWLKSRQNQFLTQALGGPADYKGRSMKMAHTGLAIKQSHFDLVAKHLVETLASLKVPQALIDEVVAGVAPLAGEIVNSN